MTSTTGTAGTRSDPGRPPLGTGRLESVGIGDLRLDAGVVLPDVTVAYRHDGPGPASGARQVLVIHALTGSSDAAGDWWAPVIGPGLALDTDDVGVLCSNLLGGRYGTTGPISIDPGTGRPYGPSFPTVTVRDQARAIWRLLDALGIGELALVTGGSLGGMVALEVALERPGATRLVLPIAAPAATGALAMGWNAIQISLVEKFRDDGLALARQLAMTTYRSEADFDGRFGRATEADGRLSVASYLEYQGRKLLDRFDPDTYRVLVAAMDTHDVGRERGGVEAALAALAGAGTALTAVGIPGDILYGPTQVHALLEAAHAAGMTARYREIDSPKGHDSFLVEWDQLADILREALSED